jgi:CheY-like chemotaxis protein
LIVDDNTQHSELVKENLELEFQKLGVSYNIATIFPFQTFEEYFTYISENNVCLIILDEKLNDQPDSRGNNVNYLGHNLVTILREREKDIPIYTVTNFSTNDDVQGAFQEYDHIISRRDFIEHTDKYVPMMIRASSKFVDRHSETLSELSKLSEEIASGNTSGEKYKRVLALQAALQLPLIGFDDRLSWLNEYENQINELEEIRKELITKLGK